MKKTTRINNWLSIRNDASSTTLPAEIMIYDQIGKDWYDEKGISAQEFDTALKGIPKDQEIIVRINSPGGNVWDGLAIYNMLKARGEKVTTRNEGIAASIASIIFMAGAKRIMPKAAMMMMHKASGGQYGNSDDMRAMADKLDAHDSMLASVYEKHCTVKRADLENMMDVETWLSGEDCIAKGFCDEMTEEEPVTNSAELPRFKNTPQNLLKKPISALPPQGERTENHNPPANPGQPQEKTVRKENIALLNRWGIAVKDEASVTDARLEELVNLGKVNALAAWTGTPAPAAAAPAAPVVAANPADMVTQMLAQVTAQQTQINAREKALRRTSLRNSLDQLVSQGRIPGNSVDNWLTQAEAAFDDVTNGNPVLANLGLLDAREPGSSPVNIEFGEGGQLSIERLNKTVNDVLEPLHNFHRNARKPDEQDRKVIGLRNKQMSNLIAVHAKYVKSAEYPHGELTGPLRASWDRWASGLGSVQNANTMSADLQRQLVLSEIMRAFKREFARLSIFSHNYGNVPLEGNDYVKVPYYPLDTTASTEYKQADGYVIGANAQTSAKSIFVGGKGDGVASAGSGRKYKSLKFNGYEINRQPWLDIAKLCALAGEQLAIDVRADILGARISQAKFGNAIWTGGAGAFDNQVVAKYLKLAAIQAFWPKGAGHVILAPTYWTNLCADPIVNAFLSRGNANTINKGDVGELYGFGTFDYDALLPVANYIRGGDGTVTAGADVNLAGFMALESAILIATAPIMPPPGVLKYLLAFDMATDEQTGLTLCYRYWGAEQSDEDNNIIECTYGSGDGEAAALKRFTSQGL